MKISFFNKIQKIFKSLGYYFRVYYHSIIYLCKKKIRKTLRRFKKIKIVDPYSFVILCVKNKNYVKLAINNINSLHYLNPSHKFSIHCDDICYEELQKNQKAIDYKKNVHISNLYQNDGRPWQLSKIESLITAGKNNQILIDADSLWHNDPKINFDKIIFQVRSSKFRERKDESLVMSNLFIKPEWLEFDHYVTGFVSIPSKFMSEKLVNDFRYLTDKILTDDLYFLDDSQKENITRISEELAVNIAVQSNYDKEYISTLKINDVKGDKNIFQSLYFGCANKIIE